MAGNNSILTRQERFDKFLECLKKNKSKLSDYLEAMKRVDNEAEGKTVEEVKELNLSNSSEAEVETVEKVKELNLSNSRYAYIDTQQAREDVIPILVKKKLEESSKKLFEVLEELITNGQINPNKWELLINKRIPDENLPTLTTALKSVKFDYDASTEGAHLELLVAALSPLMKKWFKGNEKSKEKKIIRLVKILTSLINKGFTDEEIKTLKNALEPLTKKKSVSTDDIQDLTKTLGPSVKKGLTDKDLRAFADALQPSKKIKHEDFSVITTTIRATLGLTDVDFQSLAQALEANTTITSLNLSHNHITDEVAFYLAKMLKKNATITSLNLSYNKITDKGVGYIMEALKENSTLTEINLAGNAHIANKGEEPWSEKLGENTKLKKLDLSSTCIGNKGAADLIKHTKLETLLLSNSAIVWPDDIHDSHRTKEKRNELRGHIITLANNLKNNIHLKELNLRGNKLRHGGIVQIANALEENKHLKDLDIESNEVKGRDDGPGWIALAEALKKNTTLTQLEFAQEPSNLFTSATSRNITQWLYEYITGCVDINKNNENKAEAKKRLKLKLINKFKLKATKVTTKSKIDKERAVTKISETSAEKKPTNSPETEPKKPEVDTKPAVTKISETSAENKPTDSPKTETDPKTKAFFEKKYKKLLRRAIVDREIEKIAAGTQRRYGGSKTYHKYSFVRTIKQVYASFMVTLDTTLARWFTYGPVDVLMFVFYPYPEKSLYRKVNRLVRQDKERLEKVIKIDFDETLKGEDKAPNSTILQHVIYEARRRDVIVRGEPYTEQVGEETIEEREWKPHSKLKHRYLRTPKHPGTFFPRLETKDDQDKRSTSLKNRAEKDFKKTYGEDGKLLCKIYRNVNPSSPITESQKEQFKALHEALYAYQLQEALVQAEKAMPDPAYLSKEEEVLIQCFKEVEKAKEALESDKKIYSVLRYSPASLQIKNDILTKHLVKLVEKTSSEVDQGNPVADSVLVSQQQTSSRSGTSAHNEKRNGLS